jgi:hypothetical protein
MSGSGIGNFAMTSEINSTSRPPPDPYHFAKPLLLCSCGEQKQNIEIPVIVGLPLTKLCMMTVFAMSVNAFGTKIFSH